MRIEGLGLSDPGLVRARNEDYIITDNDLNFYVVCDGVGGSGNGNIASKLAAESCRAFLKANESFFNDYYKTGNIKILETLLRSAIDEACYEVYKAAHADSKLHGMASTLTSVLIVNDKAIVGHVGDSRLYLIRNNQVYTVTEDHTLGREARSREEMSDEEIKKHRLDSILNRSIGCYRSVEIDTLIFDILPGDELILCTDGMHNYLRNPVQLIPFLEHDEINTALSQMVQFAIDGGGSDNISVILLRTKLEESIYMGFSDEKTNLLNNFNILSKSFLFKDMNFIRLNRLMNVMEIFPFSAGEIIVEKGVILDGLYLIATGEVEVIHEDKKLNEVLKTGQSFGEKSLVKLLPAEKTYTAKNSCSILFISSENFKKLCHNHPRFGVKLLENLLQILV